MTATNRFSSLRSIELKNVFPENAKNTKKPNIHHLSFSSFLTFQEKHFLALERMMFAFELEKGSKKYVCPNCSEKSFVPYVSNETGDKLSFDVGRCDRESKCGYHRTPKEYFADNTQTSKANVFLGSQQKTGISNAALPNKNGSQATNQAGYIPKKPDFISKDVLLRTLTNYDQNALVQFLLNLFPDDSENVWQAVKGYLIGTTKTGATIFWQIDQSRKVRTGKIIAYDLETGKRRKDIKPDWIHAALKRAGPIKPDFNLKQCFFGEHLLRSGDQKPVAIVEAEKTAVIASICFPEFIWLAIGSKQSLKPEKLKRLGNRKIVLYPDADGFALWQKTALEARANGQSVKVSNLIERCGTDAEKGKGFDLADYLISEQSKVNQYNSFTDFYNAKLAAVLSDKDLNNQFNSILDEQKAILIIDGGLSEIEAESRIADLDNIRRIVLSV